MKIGDKLRIKKDAFDLGDNNLNGKMAECFDINEYGYGFLCDGKEFIVTPEGLECFFEPVEYQPKHAKEGIEHPSHYNNEGGMECWDEMELIFGTEATMWFCLLSAWKYRYRMNDKDTPEKNMRKSNECIKKYKQLKEKLEK